MPESTNPLSSFVVPNSDQTHYTPSFEEARAEYVTNRSFRFPTTTPIAEEFDRFVAAVRAAALDEAAEVVKSQTPDPAEWGTEWAEGFEQATETSASAIRALKEEKK